MSKTEFNNLMGKIANGCADKVLDEHLEHFLNAEFPSSGEDFSRLKQLCEIGEQEGWLMADQARGIKYGRAIKPGADAGGFSVDVVRMKNVRGPHHVHTKGEIGAIMPIDGAPDFDGKPEGWYVYGAGSDHHPTVTGGDAYILYLLPDGAIEFTRN